MTDRDHWYIAFVAAVASLVVVVSLIVIGNTQANQYRQVVTDIDHNARAIVCILLIAPTERTPEDARQCLAAQP